jgi:hypothetical protein
MKAIFLSASVPLPHRDAEYLETVDVVAIRDSIRALVGAVLPKGKIVFGGHPAITPLMHLLAMQSGHDASKHIVLYQSMYFQSQLLPELEHFADVKFVDAIAGDRDANLSYMREVMIRSERFYAGIFIGGMEGVEVEFEIFRRMQSGALALPIASTGAAALRLFREHCPDDTELRDELRYLSLFRRRLTLTG